MISNGHSSHFFNVTESLLYITYQHKPTEASLLGCFISLTCWMHSSAVPHMTSHSLTGHLNCAGKEKCPSSSMGSVHLDLGSKWTVSRGNSAMCGCQDLHMATMSRRRVAVKCFDFKHEKVIFLPFFCLYFSWSFWKEIRSASQIDHFFIFFCYLISDFKWSLKSFF